MTLLIVIVVIVVVALVFGYRYDRKHKRLGDASTGGVMGARGRATRLEGKQKAAESGTGI